MELNGRFYSVLREQNRYSEDLKRCIEDTVEELLSIDISANKPGMLLGKIQSGVGNHGKDTKSNNSGTVGKI